MPSADGGLQGLALVCPTVDHLQPEQALVIFPLIHSRLEMVDQRERNVMPVGPQGHPAVGTLCPAKRSPAGAGQRVSFLLGCSRVPCRAALRPRKRENVSGQAGLRPFQSLSGQHVRSLSPCGAHVGNVFKRPDIVSSSFS